MKIVDSAPDPDPDPAPDSNPAPDPESQQKVTTLCQNFTQNHHLWTQMSTPLG